jgi:hypothetical protein
MLTTYIKYWFNYKRAYGWLSTPDTWAEFKTEYISRQLSYAAMKPWVDAAILAKQEAKRLNSLGIVVHSNKQVIYAKTK